MKTSHAWKESPNEKFHFMNTTQYGLTADRHTAANSHKPVTFFCAAPHAKSVEIAGDFNRWEPMPMHQSSDGWWLAQIELDLGHHQYQFLVDGRPMLDAYATEAVRNEQGERVSLLAVS